MNRGQTRGLLVAHHTRSGLPCRLRSKESTCQCRRHRRCWFHPWVGKIPLEEGMATQSSILAWRIPWREEPGSLQSIGSPSQTRLKWLSMHALGRDLNERTSHIYLRDGVPGMWNKCNSLHIALIKIWKVECWSLCQIPVYVSLCFMYFTSYSMYDSFTDISQLWNFPLCPI